jgi:uncharacterized protein
MTELPKQSIDDPITAPFWEGALRNELMLQKCNSCGTYQFYPRPFCLKCESDTIGWVRASGNGTVYSLTVVRIEVSAELPPPYVVAIIQLDEGPRMLATLRGKNCKNGDRVRVVWRERGNAPPLPEFAIIDGAETGKR